MAAERRTRGDGFDAERKAWFLAALRQGETVLAACTLVGISNRTAYNHRNRDPDFARLWALAQSAARCPAELEAYKRGVLGIEEPVYKYGRLSHHRVRQSDSLLIALLKARHPKRYGSAAGVHSARRKIEKRVLAHVEAELAPLREALSRAEAELAELRAVRNAHGDANGVNFVNVRPGPASTSARAVRGAKKRPLTRFDLARRREKGSETSRMARRS